MAFVFIGTIIICRCEWKRIVQKGRGPHLENDAVLFLPVSVDELGNLLFSSKPDPPPIPNCDNNDSHSNLESMLNALRFYPLTSRF